MSYGRIEDCLRDWLDKPWSELPAAQHKAWHTALSMAGGTDEHDGKLWDSRNDGERMYVIRQYDCQHDPANEDDNDAQVAAFYRVNRDIEEWKRMNHQGDIIKAKIRKNELQQLNAELEALEQRYIKPAIVPDEKPCIVSISNTQNKKARHLVSMSRTKARQKARQ